MKLATTATVCPPTDADDSRGRARSSADVNRWVAMIDAELQHEDGVTPREADSIEVTLEFGRTTIDLAAQPLTVGDSLRLDQLADEPLDVVVAGRSIAHGELVAVDGRWGVRIVELLMLAVAWFAFGSPTTFADERPRERAASILFDDDPPELLETPFGSARANRSKNNDTPWRTGDVSPLVNAQRNVSTPLSPRSAASDINRASSNAALVRPGWSATVWPLLFVVALIVIGARWLKSRSPSAARGLPNEAFEVLGRKAIDARTSVVLARCGSRLLVLNQSPHGLRTLAEITDPVEVDCLAGLCRSAQRDQSLAETFRSMLHKPTGSKTVPTTPSLEERLAARQTIANHASLTQEARS